MGKGPSSAVGEVAGPRCRVWRCRLESRYEGVCVESRADFMVWVDQGSEGYCAWGVGKATCVSGFILSTSECVTFK